MTLPNDPDQMFHENLRTLGGRLSTPAGPSRTLRSRCTAAIGAAATPRAAMFRRPVWLSTVALAASIALAFGLLFPTNGGPTVQAATILARLREQIAAPKLLELTIKDITVEKASVSGHIQLAKEGIAGDISAVVDADEMGLIEIDASFGISQDGGWILIRKLVVPDEDVQLIINLLLPPGTETLLKLPEDIDLPGLDLDFADAIKELSSAHKMLETFTEIVRNQSDTRATVTERRDGTIVLTLPIDDSDSLTEFARMAAQAMKAELKSQGKDDEADEIDVDDIDIDIKGDEAKMLVGSTLKIEYDPEAELVRRFEISNFGESKGSISIELSDGEIDENLLDAERVSGPNTRVVDLSALKSLIESLGG